MTTDKHRPNRRPSQLLDIRQASSRFPLTDRQARADFQDALDGADFAGFTEVGDVHRLALLREVCRDAGFWLAYHGSTDTAIAGAKRHHKLDSGNIPVIPKQPGPASKGGHGPRGVTWADAEVDELGVVTICEAHWVTGYGRSEQRREQHQRLTEAALDKVVESAHGRGHLGFLLGDANVGIDDHGDWKIARQEWLFAEAGVSTIYDELDRRVPTHDGGTIDIIASVDADGRVEGVDVDAYDQQGDHNRVRGLYRVRQLR